jgi:hypothetical protein
LPNYDALKNLETLKTQMEKVCSVMGSNSSLYYWGKINLKDFTTPSASKIFLQYMNERVMFSTLPCNSVLRPTSIK